MFNFTFLIFQIKSWSNGNRWQSIVNIMLLNLSASCCNFTGRIALHIKISSKFDVDVCVTFLSLNWCGHHKEPCSFGILFEVLCITIIKSCEFNVHVEFANVIYQKCNLPVVQFSMSKMLIYNGQLIKCLFNHNLENKLLLTHNDLYLILFLLAILTFPRIL